MSSEDLNKNIEEEVNKDAVEPFKVTKEGIDYLIQQYLNRKFTEDIDYISRLERLNTVQELSDVCF